MITGCPSDARALIDWMDRTLSIGFQNFNAWNYIRLLVIPISHFKLALPHASDEKSRRHVRPSTFQRLSNTAHQKG